GERHQLGRRKRSGLCQRSPPDPRKQRDDRDDHDAHAPRLAMMRYLPHRLAGRAGGLFDIETTARIHGAAPFAGERQERAAELARAVEPLLARARETSSQHGLELDRSIGTDLAQRREILFADLREDLADRLAREGGVTAQELVQNDAERPEIAAAIDVF